jgi:hypothetical protein
MITDETAKCSAWSPFAQRIRQSARLNILTPLTSSSQALTGLIHDRLHVAVREGGARGFLE